MSSSQVSRDAAFALSIAQAEQERADARLAQQLSQGQSRGATPASRSGPLAGNGSSPSVNLRCGACSGAANVVVPPGSAPGAVVRANCPHCSAANDFTVPGGGGNQAFHGQQSFSQGLGFNMGQGGASNFAPGGMLGGGGVSAASRSTSDFMPPPAYDGGGDPMAYVVCEIGNVAVEMMVDTGAESSVISMPLVRRLNLTGCLDTSRQGVASGVGSARISGRLRNIPVKMGQVEFQLDFIVLEVSEEIFMLGIDQMRKFKCVVDLERQSLIFGGRSGVQVPLLKPSRSRQQPAYQRGGSGCPQM